MSGSFSRVLVMLSTGTAMRAPVPGPRFDCRMSGRPGLLEPLELAQRVRQADLREQVAR